jgi:hypothetical protein
LLPAACIQPLAPEQNQWQSHVIAAVQSVARLPYISSPQSISAHCGVKHSEPNHRLKERRAKVCARFSRNVGASKAKSKNKLGVARLQSSSLTAAKNRKWRISEMNQSQCFPSVIQRSLARAAFSISPASVNSLLMQYIASFKAGSQQAAQGGRAQSGAPFSKQRWMQVMNMKRVALAALLICMSAEIVAQEISTPRFPSQQITRDELNQLYEKTKALPHASIRRVRHQVVITAPNSRYFSTTYVFTQPGHPAHPAVVIHDILEMETGHVAQLESYYAGSQLKFEAWVKEFVYTPYAIYPPTY